MKQPSIATAWAVLLCSFVFIACNKNSSSTTAVSNGTITATIDGTNVNFSTTAMAQRDSSNGLNSISIIGFVGSNSTPNEIILSVASPSPIGVNTYFETSASDKVNIWYTQYSGPNVYNVYQDAGSATNPATITITSITATTVSGTFQGLLVNSSSPSQTKAIANGQFAVNFSN